MLLTDGPVIICPVCVEWVQLRAGVRVACSCISWEYVAHRRVILMAAYTGAVRAEGTKYVMELPLDEPLTLGAINGGKGKQRAAAQLRQSAIKSRRLQNKIGTHLGLPPRPVDR